MDPFEKVITFSCRKKDLKPPHFPTTGFDRSPHDSGRNWDFLVDLFVPCEVVETSKNAAMWETCSSSINV